MIHVFVTSHGGMAEGILESVEMLIGKQENLTAITFGKEMGVDELEECFQKEIVDVSEKNQYLILCDLKGGTPFNTASRFSFKNENVAVMYPLRSQHINCLLKYFHIHLPGCLHPHIFHIPYSFNS